jgi:type I restriction enzyme S subunit
MYGSIGKLGIAGQRMTCNQAIAFADPDGMPSKYLLYYLQFIKPDLIESGKGGTQRNISQEVLKRTPLLLAPPDQQEALVARVDELFSDLDAGVAALERAKANLARYRAAVLKAAVEGRLTWQWRGEGPSTKPNTVDCEGTALPRGWVQATVDQLADKTPHSLTDGPFGSNLKTAHYRESGPRVVRLQNIGDGVFIDDRAHISLSHYHKLVKHAAYPGDVLVAMLGDDVPRACLVPDWLGPAIVKADCVRFAPDPALVTPAYLTIALNATPTRARARRLIRGVGRPRLGLTRFRQIPLPVPPLKEQEVIVSTIASLMSVADSTFTVVNDVVSRTLTLRSAVLERAFSGRLL